MGMSAMSNSNTRTIVVMHGDQTGEELLLEALRVMVPDLRWTFSITTSAWRNDAPQKMGL
jgi:hypothetical protein